MKGVTLKRWRGQHILNDGNVLKKIVSAAAIQPTDTVVEIGAGTGNLTVLLARRARRVIAIEIDNDLIPILRERCKDYPNVEIIHDDARTFDHTNYELQTTNYFVVANIPYNITSLLIRKFLEADVVPSKMILLIQKEVALRICAQPPHMSLLAVAVQYYAHPRVLFSVGRTCFSPRPNVDSAVIEIMEIMGSGAIKLIAPDPIISIISDHVFFRVVHAGFAHKRKLLISNLAPVIPAKAGIQIVDIFSQLHIPPTARAQELSLDQWKALCAALSKTLTD
ncbi:ribosomal RNA small subunit methyltransferase A [Candidatus Uhrbacteria bacterium]|nr:ribosomal RNA small subunit methyltransferase A [Candidatus Uhrbacteria bacterium]